MIKKTLDNPSPSALPEQTSHQAEPPAQPASRVASAISARDALVTAAPSSSNAVPPKPCAATPSEPEARSRKRLEISGALRLFTELPQELASMRQQRSGQLLELLSDIETLATSFAARDYRGNFDALHAAACKRQDEIYAAVQQIRDEPVRASLNWNISTIIGTEAARAQRSAPPPPPPAVTSVPRYTIVYDVNNDRGVLVDEQGQPVTNPAILATVQAAIERPRASELKCTNVDVNQRLSDNVDPRLDHAVDLLRSEAARPSAPVISGPIRQRDPYTHPATYFLALTLIDHPDVGVLARKWLAHNDGLFEVALGIGKNDKPKVRSRWCVGPRVTPNPMRKEKSNVGTRDAVSDQELVALHGFAGAPTRATKRAIYNFDVAMAEFGAHGVVTSIQAALSQDLLYQTISLMPPRKKTVCVDPEGKVLPAFLLNEALATLQKAQRHLATLTDDEQTVIAQLKDLAEAAETMDRESKADGAVWTQVTYFVQHMPELAQLVQDIDNQMAKVDAMFAARARLTKKEKRRRPNPPGDVERLRADIDALAHQHAHGPPAVTADPTPPSAPVSPSASKSFAENDVLAAFAKQTADIDPHGACVQVALDTTVKLWTRLPNARALKNLISTCCDAATFSRFDDAADWEAKARALAYHMNKHAAPQTPVEDYLKRAFALYRSSYNNELAPRIGGQGTYVRVVRTETHVGIYGWDGTFINYYARNA